MTQPDLKLLPRKPRQRVLKGAAILTNSSDYEVSCVVRNMHSDGAELQLPNGVIVPDQFLLYLPFERTSYKAIVRWRQGQRAGVQFLYEDHARHHPSSKWF